MDQLLMIQWKPTLRAIQHGFIDQTDLLALGVTPSAVRQYIARRFARIGKPRTYVSRVSVNGVTQEYTALYAEELAGHIELLSVFDCMDLVDKETMAKLLQSHQVVANNSLAGRRPLTDRDMVHGLFWCMGSTPLEDTYHSLVTLSKLEGLDRIDRDACIEGILRFHHGKGLFGSLKKHDGLCFDGDTHDTFYAYESLRLLNGLDQVKDLHKWTFRPVHRSDRLAQQATRRITWSEVEAHLLTQRLKKFAAECKPNPRLAAPSLLICY